MNGLPATLRVMLDLGFEQAEDVFGMPTVRYHLPNLPLTCSVGISKYFQDVVSVSGVLNTGREITMVACEISPELLSTEEVAAWLVYALGKRSQHLEPLPEWVALGQVNQHVIPAVDRQMAYQERPFCLVDRDFARILRSRLADILREAACDTALRVLFDGRVLVAAVGPVAVEIPAEGNAWEGYAETTSSEILTLPQRFMKKRIPIDYWNGELGFASFRYGAKWVEETEA